MTTRRDPYGVRLDDLSIDWDALAAEIGRKSSGQPRRHSHGKAIGVAALAATMILTVGILIVQRNGEDFALPEGAEIYGLAGEVNSYALPTSFQALSGYPDHNDQTFIDRYLADDL